MKQKFCHLFFYSIFPPHSFYPSLLSLSFSLSLFLPLSTSPSLPFFCFLSDLFLFSHLFVLLPYFFISSFSFFQCFVSLASKKIFKSLLSIQRYFFNRLFLAIISGLQTSLSWICAGFAQRRTHTIWGSLCARVWALLALNHGI
jgi:hypothetical protein